MNELRNDAIEVFVYNQAKEGNLESGDAYFTYAEEEYFICAIADGLGNGPVAKQSAEIIPMILARYHFETVDELLQRCNEYMIQKRGAAVAVFKVHFKEQLIHYSCVGNIKCYILRNGEKMVYPLPVSGYLSGRPLKLRSQQIAYQIGDLFFLHSDGITLRSPSSLLKKSRNVYDLYRNAMNESFANDDVTFIAGNLLR